MIVFDDYFCGFIFVFRMFFIKCFVWFDYIYFVFIFRLRFFIVKFSLWIEVCRICFLKFWFFEIFDSGFFSSRCISVFEWMSKRTKFEIFEIWFWHWFWFKFEYVSNNFVQQITVIDVVLKLLAKLAIMLLFCFFFRFIFRW